MKSSQRQFLVKVAGVEGLWATRTGGDITASTSKVYDGGSLEPDVLASPAEASDVVISRGYDPYRDGPIIRDLKRRVGRFRSTVSATPTDEDLVPIDEPSVYPEALLVGLVEPEYDAQSGDAAMVQLTFAVAGWK